MDSLGKLSCLVDDLDRYNLAFETYEKHAVTHGFKSWINKDLPEVVSQLKKTFAAGGVEARLLSIGSGTGRLDSQIVQQFQHHFRNITNHVVEPSKEAMSTYQELVGDSSNHLSTSTTTFEWHNMTFDQYQTSRRRLQSGGEATAPRKFHFISAVHSLYYAEDPQSAVSYLYDLLEDGGQLLIVMQDEESGIERIVRRFDLFNEAANQVDAFAAIRNHLQSVNIKYETHMMPASYDVTSCFQETEEGSLILDFISHAAHFKQTASNQVQHDLLEYMRSERCSELKGDRVLMDATEVALIITK